MLRAIQRHANLVSSGKCTVHPDTHLGRARPSALSSTRGLRVVTTACCGITPASPISLLAWRRSLSYEVRSCRWVLSSRYSLTLAALWAALFFKRLSYPTKTTHTRLTSPVEEEASGTLFRCCFWRLTEESTSTTRGLAGQVAPIHRLACHCSGQHIYHTS